MDLERLDEAIRAAEGRRLGMAIVPLVEAARAYRDILADGQRVEWCDVHESKLADQGLCQWVAWGKDITAVKPYDPMACSIVSRLLSVYPKEAENER